MVFASLWINVLVLIPICMGLLLNLSGMDPVFGKKTTARQILTCMYLSILGASVVLLTMNSAPVEFVQFLLAIQITYKLLSVVLISDKKTPVLWFNLAIALFHTMTLLLM